MEEGIMRKIKYFNKKSILALGICCGLAGYLFMNHRNQVSAADDAITGLDIGYHQCENSQEEILDEDVSETISVQVVDLKEQGKSCIVGEAIELENGYYHQIEKEDGYSVVAGIHIKDKNYVVTLNSDEAISEEAVKGAVEELEKKLG